MPDRMLFDLNAELKALRGGPQDGRCRSSDLRADPVAGQNDHSHLSSRPHHNGNKI
jgi:hypothetical protein